MASTLGVEGYRFKSFCSVRYQNLSSRRPFFRVGTITMYKSAKIMRLKEFNYFFLNPMLSNSCDTLKKTPNNLFKQYLIRTRLNNYICIDYNQYFSLLQRIIYFLQSSVCNRCSFVFFFDTLNLIALYKELTLKCNEYWAFTPKVYSWITSWTPKRVFSETDTIGLPGVVENSVAVVASPVLINLAFLLLHHKWPLIVSLPAISDQIQNKYKSSLAVAAYILPASSYLNVCEQYFRAAFLTKVIRNEKLRV